jgi:hypothetical protein
MAEEAGERSREAGSRQGRGGTGRAHSRGCVFMQSSQARHRTSPAAAKSPTGTSSSHSTQHQCLSVAWRSSRCAMDAWRQLAAPSRLTSTQCTPWWGPWWGKDASHEVAAGAAISGDSRAKPVVSYKPAIPLALVIGGAGTNCSKACLPECAKPLRVYDAPLSADTSSP